MLLLLILCCDKRKKEDRSKSTRVRDWIRPHRTGCRFNEKPTTPAPSTAVSYPGPMANTWIMDLVEVVRGGRWWVYMAVVIYYARACTLLATLCQPLLLTLPTNHSLVSSTARHGTIKFYPSFSCMPVYLPARCLFCSHSATFFPLLHSFWSQLVFVRPTVGPGTFG